MCLPVASIPLSPGKQSQKTLAQLYQDMKYFCSGPEFTQEPIICSFPGHRRICQDANSRIIFYFSPLTPQLEPPESYRYIPTWNQLPKGSLLKAEQIQLSLCSKRSKKSIFKASFTAVDMFSTVPALQSILWCQLQSSSSPSSSLALRSTVHLTETPENTAKQS